MFLIIAIILLAIWGLGLAIRVVGGIIHIVLVLAVVMLVLHVAQRRGMGGRFLHQVESVGRH